MGIQTLVDSQKLSSAQVQRVLIARSLLHSPKILFLDEATSGLDEASQVSIVNTIRQLGMTCVIISHRRELTKLVDRVFTLDAGRLMSE